MELTLANVRCRACEKVFAPLLLLGLHNKRRTGRWTVDLPELATQMSFARAAGSTTGWPGPARAPGRRTAR